MDDSIWVAIIRQNLDRFSGSSKFGDGAAAASLRRYLHFRRKIGSAHDFPIRLKQDTSGRWFGGQRQMIIVISHALRKAPPRAVTL
jgi:hypothetical protein